MPLVMGCFVLLAVFITANIVLNIFGHFRPVDVSVDHLDGSIHTHVAGQLALLFGFHYFHMEAGIIRDPEFAFAEEYSIFVCNQRGDTPFKGSAFHYIIIQSLLDRIVR